MGFGLTGLPSAWASPWPLMAYPSYGSSLGLSCSLYFSETIHLVDPCFILLLGCIFYEW